MILLEWMGDSGQRPSFFVKGIALWQVCGDGHGSNGIVRPSCEITGGPC